MRIIFVGASGHGKVCAEVAELCGDYDEILFLDGDRSLKECGGHPVVGIECNFEKYIGKETEFFVSIGNPEIRKRMQEKIEKHGGRVATLIHPESVVSKNAEINLGSIIMAGAVINSGSKIGRGVIVNTSSSVDHDCKIGDYCHIAVGAHICGTVNLREKIWIGTGANVINNISICAGCMIGAGAVVISNIEEKGTYVGVPAKKKSNSMP